jgi:hypothetical protein
VKRTRLIVSAILAASILATSSIVAWRLLQSAGPIGNPQGNGSPVSLSFDVSHVGGAPEMNTTDFWVARIKQVSSNESLSSYRASLLRNGSILVDLVIMRPGRLGESTQLIFEFFDWGTYCSPIPCPPPDGPDGNLSVNDYFRISYPDSGTTYTVRVIWAPTGETAGEIVIHT